MPTTRRRLADRLDKRNADVYAIINDLVEENWVIENEIPSEARMNNAVKMYLGGLTPQERKSLRTDGVIPTGADSPPDSFVKPKFRCSQTKQDSD